MRRRCIRFESDTLRKFPRRRRYLIGVSGGRDSVALLHWLVDLGYHKLIVCHLDHQLRGRSSRADARFVEKLAGKYDVGLDLALGNVRALAERTKISPCCATEFAVASFLIWRNHSAVAFGRISGEPLSSPPKKRTGSKANCQTQWASTFRSKSCGSCH